MVLLFYDRTTSTRYKKETDLVLFHIYISSTSTQEIGKKSPLMILFSLHSVNIKFGDFAGDSGPCRPPSDKFLLLLLQGEQDHAHTAPPDNTH